MNKKLPWFFLLIGCQTTHPVVEKTIVCTTEYEPHLCVLTIDDIMYAGYGTNRCNALKSLQESLKIHKHNPNVSYKSNCEKVY